MGNKKYAIVILAAGSSVRLGRPKQVVAWNNTTLLNYTVAQALPIKNSDVYLALSPTQLSVRSSIIHELTIIDIPNHHEGMGSTISSCLSKIPINKYEAIILSVCDQPFISNNIFCGLIEEYESNNCRIVISKYTSAFGPPTLFSKEHFKDLLALNGKNGARKVVENEDENVSSFPFPKGEIDIDTLEDYNALAKLKK